MKIYTKTGDEGSTSRPGGQRVPKYDPLIDATGGLDELNAHIGWCVCSLGDQRHAEIREAIQPVQAELLTAGALLAAAGTDCLVKLELAGAAVSRMEGQIDVATDKLPELRHFIFPGGCEAACRLHIARSVCRRVERAVACAAGVESHIPAVIFKYLNRLSDLLFTLARLANWLEGRQDDIWDPGGKR